MGIPLQVLIVEDSADDALLLLHELRRGGYPPAHQRVDTPEALDAAFAKERFDLVLVDHTMPQFNGLAALTMVKEKDPDVPFIFVSGTIGEDSAVAAMRAGAHDYIMKSNTKRLLPAIDRELREAGERRARRRAEDELRLMQNVMLAVSDAADVDAALSAALRLICETTGCESGQAWLLSSAADHLACSPAWYGCGASADTLRGASTRLRLGPGMGLPGRVWSTLQPICSTDLTREERGVRAEALADTSFKAAVAVPISAGTELVAVLELFRAQPPGDQQRLVTSLSAIAAQLGGVIQRKRDEERMRYLANFDALTGLSNRILFYDRLRQALIDAQRHDRLVGVAFIDLDRFKAVNDSLGHEAGDVLLKSVGERLIGCVRQGDTVARISGDEFALILADMHQADDAARLAHKIVEGFAEPFHLKSKKLFIGCSLGLAMFPADETSPEGLVRYAMSRCIARSNPAAMLINSIDRR